MSVVGRRHFTYVGLGLAGLIIALGVSRQNLEGQAKNGAAMAPVFEVDPLWPKPLPNHWVLGSLGGIAVDDQDHIWLLRRETLEELTAFGDGGRQPGQFYGVHVIATDSKGNLYTAETYEGHRVQRFLFKGVKPVTRKYQGVVWPGSSK